jgi:2-hydroxycyclohexanecarboxyl-CoA dehydrogenase
LRQSGRLNGVFHTIQSALPDLIGQKWGRIVTISSHAAQAGAAGRSHYSAAKGGVISLTKSLAQELAAYGITVNTIRPSLVDTPMFRKAGYITGQQINVNDGMYM